MSRNYVFASGEYYHIYAHGVEDVLVYRDHEDYKRFMECLYLLNTKKPVNIDGIKKLLKRGLTSHQTIYEINEGDEKLVDIGAWCLMPNHFHILVRIKESDIEGKGLSKFMQKLMTSYTMYFNKKNERIGALFGSSFKAQHVTEDNYLKYLFSYIHLNPVKLIQADWKEKGIKDIKKATVFLENYKYSSYQDYLESVRPENAILNRGVFPDYFNSSIKQMKEEMEGWLSIEK